MTIAQPAHNRTNDAAVDPHGRLWVGTMDNDEQAGPGTIRCLDRGVLRATGAAGAVVTNGPACCAVNHVIYHVDSARRRIWRSPLRADASLAESTLFLQHDEEDGYPDGVVVDSEGCLWVALWDGWGVRRYSPQGDLIEHIAMPCARVTRIAFGGPDLRTAYVAPASTGLDAKALGEQPLARAVLAFDAGTAGVVAPPCRMGSIRAVPGHQ